MPVLSSAAWIAHDLGLATSIGGSLFGQAALEPSLATLGDPTGRKLSQEEAGVDGRAKGLQRAVSAAGTLNLASNVGVAAVTALLAHARRDLP